MQDHSCYQEIAGASLAYLDVPCVVILVHFGEAGTTRRCLDSLSQNENASVPVVISDHGPDLSLAEQLRDHPAFPSLRILRRDNTGFGAGCNAAAQTAFSAGAQWVWFLNNDATMDSPVLSHLMQLAHKFPQVGLWGTHQLDGTRNLGSDPLPVWFPTPGFSTPKVEGLPVTCQQLDARQTLSGASILASKTAWERMGPWPEWCFLYWEDVTWCLKAHELGIPIVMTDLKIIHPRNTTTGHHSPVTTYYGVRNGLLLHEEYWPTRKGQRNWQVFHLLQKRFFQGKWDMLGPTIKGVLDAKRGIRFRKA